jgi:hypothetical protein
MGGFCENCKEISAPQNKVFFYEVLQISKENTHHGKAEEEMVFCNTHVV